MVGNYTHTLQEHSQILLHHNDVNYLPTSSYYQISDLNSNDTIIPFGDYSKISCGGSKW